MNPDQPEPSGERLLLKGTLFFLIENQIPLLMQE